MAEIMREIKTTGKDKFKIKQINQWFMKYD